MTPMNIIVLLLNDFFSIMNVFSFRCLVLDIALRGLSFGKYTNYCEKTRHCSRLFTYLYDFHEK